MKIISLNVNGIRAAARKGLYEWLAAQQADFVCLQEIRAQIHQLQNDPIYFPSNESVTYYDAVKPGYSGVAIYSKHQPTNIVRGLGFDTCDIEGRYLQFDYANFSVVSVYFPSGSSGENRQEIKYDFLDRFAQHVLKLQSAGKDLIFCGDFNIAHQARDLKNWRANQTHTGFLPEERAWMDYLFDKLGLVDAFRVKNQESDQYTWWSNRGQAWAKNVGWRIDYQIISPSLAQLVTNVDIYRDTRFSDHAPLTVCYAGDNWF